MTTIDTATTLVPAKADDRQRLAKAATQFEAIFVRQMLAAARKADFGNDLFDSQGADTFRQMMDDRFADIMANNGSLGFAKTIEARLASQIEPAAPHSESGE